MKKKLLFIFIIIHSFYSFSQQDSHYVQYMYNMNIINPAYAGVHESFNVRAFSRQQWVGIKGAPTTHTFTIQSPLGTKNLGGALSFITDKIGPVSQTNIFADISYGIKLSSESKLAFGIKGGYINLDKNLENLLTNNPENYSKYPLSYSTFNLGIGTFFYTKQYYLGLSVPYLLNDNFSGETTSESKKGKNYFISGGYVYNLRNGNKIKPSFMYRGIDKTIESLDLSLNMFFTNGLEVGTSYRIVKAMSGMVNYSFGENKSFRIGYAYEYNFSELSEFSNGSHEIMLMYDFSFKKNNFTWRGVCF